MHVPTQTSIEKKINIAVRKGIGEAVQELLSDQDRGFELSSEAARRLRFSMYTTGLITVHQINRWDKAYKN
jgi:hypothetical protein